MAKLESMLEDGLTSLFDDYKKQEVQNIDLLYRSLNDMYAFLMTKKDQLEQGGTPEEIAYINGQISGYKLTLAVMNAFFDN